MRRKFTLPIWLILLFVSTDLFAQAECDGIRYRQEIFPNLNVTTDLSYGSNIDLQGNNLDLKLDVYEPQGDTVSLRPLIVWAHGGSFVGGSKDQGDVVAMAEPFARMGYVSASIQYRLGMAGLPFPGPDSADATESVLRAVHDAKAAVRYFYKDVRENGNTFNIDTSRIYFGGISAGAFIGLHYAYLDDMSEFPSYIDTMQAGLAGGLEGESGNPGYSTDIQGVINICGALKDTSWMKSGDLPVVSLHGPDDQIVPYGSQLLTLFLYPIIEVDGSESVHERAVEKGISTCFFTYDGQGHTPHVGSAAYTDTTVNIIRNFIYEWVCGSGGSCGYSPITDRTQPKNLGSLNFWPNPADETLSIQMPEGFQGEYDVQLIDLNGRIVQAKNSLQRTQLSLRRDGLPAGLYFLRINTERGFYTGKVIFR